MTSGTVIQRVIKYTHACVRVESQDGRVLVIDPGIWSEPHPLLDADAVVVTHEHSDHIDRLRVAGLGLPIFAPEGAELGGLPFTPVRAGQSFEAAGFRITAWGERHAPVYGASSCPNLGFLVDDDLYHPGDALVVPDATVRTLAVPMQASWLKTAEAIDFVRAVRPQRAFGIHDGQINERAVESISGWLRQEGSTEFVWLPPGAHL